MRWPRATCWRSLGWPGFRPPSADELIPLCHSLPLDYADVETWLDPPCIRLRAEAQTFSKTGVEMEALTAVSITALTIIDMGKAVDKTMSIEGVRIIEKTGGHAAATIARRGRRAHDRIDDREIRAALDRTPLIQHAADALGPDNRRG